MSTVRKYKYMFLVFLSAFNVNILAESPTQHPCSWKVTCPADPVLATVKHGSIEKLYFFFSAIIYSYKPIIPLFVAALCTAASSPGCSLISCLVIPFPFVI